MQKSWKKGLAQVGGASLLLAVPAVALLCFSSTALSAISIAVPQTQVATAAPAATQTGTAEVLNKFDETLTLVQQARAQSKALNDALRAIRKQIKDLEKNPSDPFFAFKNGLLTQTLNLIFNQRNAWDNLWRQIGVPGANVEQVQNQLIDLQVLFVDSNAALATHQANEIQTGSITTFTPPAF